MFHREFSDIEFKDLKDRFLSKIDYPSDSSCWIWNGSRRPNGYGKLVIKTGKKEVGAHRLSYYLFHGNFNEQMFICHKCDNPPCVNPMHLFVGSPKDNVSDMIRKKRQRPGIKWQLLKTQCPKGHAYSGDNLRVYNNKRYCKACISAFQMTKKRTTA